MRDVAATLTEKLGFGAERNIWDKRYIVVAQGK